MKKQLLAAVLFVAAICLVGCKHEEDGKLTSIQVSPKEVTLNEVNPSVKLAVKFTPADAKTAVDWSSSDTLVATVTSTGFVEATGYGKCYIYAQVGELKDSCAIEVKTYLESVIFTGVVYQDIDTAYMTPAGAEELVVDTLKNGKIAYPTMVTWWAMSDGFYYNNSGYLDGPATGTFLEFKAPTYYAPSYLNGGQGSFYVLGQWEVREGATDIYETTPGTVNEAEYIANMKNMIASYLENPEGEDWGNYLDAAAEAFEGPNVTVLEYNADRESYRYANMGIPDGICTYANIYMNNEGASQYMLGVDYSEVTFKPLAVDNVFSGCRWGINLDVEGQGDSETIIFVDDELHFDNTVTSIYGTIPADEVAAKQLIEVPMPAILTNPELGKQLREQVKDKNIHVLRVK